MIGGSPFARQGLFARVAAVANLARGVRQARLLLLRKRTELLIGVLGYASLGAALAARTLGIPLVVHEANAELGLANRLLVGLAERVCFGGNPTGRDLHPAPRSTEGPMRFLVMGGSEGSPFLNREAAPMFACLRSLEIDVLVQHLTGDGDVEAVRRGYAEAGVTARSPRRDFLRFWFHSPAPAITRRPTPATSWKRRPAIGSRSGNGSRDCGHNPRGFSKWGSARGYGRGRTRRGMLCGSARLSWKRGWGRRCD